MRQNPRMVREHLWERLGEKKEKKPEVKEWFFQMTTFIYLRVWESSGWPMDLWRLFLPSFPCCYVTCIFALHFYFSICSPCTSSEVLSDPSCLYVWLLLFLLNFIKNDLCFIQVQNKIPFFIFHDWISQHSVCICCRIGQYHLCITRVEPLLSEPWCSYRVHQLWGHTDPQTEELLSKDWILFLTRLVQESNYSKDHGITQM